MPKLTKRFWLLTVISTLLICSSVFAQVLDSSDKIGVLENRDRNGEEAVEPQVPADSLDETFRCTGDAFAKVC